jgi:hypothetical protein
MLEALDVRMPAADIEVEIVLAIVLSFVRLWGGGRYRHGSHDWWNGLQQAAERAECEITSDTPEQFHFSLLIFRSSSSGGLCPLRRRLPLRTARCAARTLTWLVVFCYGHFL